MVELARSRHPGLRFEQAAGEDVALDESFDYVLLSDLVPYVDDLSGAARQRRRALDARDPRRHPLLQPALAAGDRLAELLAAETAQADPELGDAERLENLLSWPASRRVDYAAHPLSEGDPVPLDVPERLRRERAGRCHLSLTWWIVARRVRPKHEELTRLDRRAVPQRGRDDRRGSSSELPNSARAPSSSSSRAARRDGTREEIERQIELHPERDDPSARPDGHGQGRRSAARLRAAKHDC